MIRVLISRLLDLGLRRRRDARLSAEIESHLDLLTDDYIAQGLSPSDARAAARRAFGGVDRITSAYREQRGLPIVEAVMQDAAFALRLLRRDRAFTATALVVLGLGIGVNNMLFTILNAHTLRGLPIHRVDRVVFVSSVDKQNGEGGVSYADYEDLQRGARTLVGLAAFTTTPMILGDEGRAPERLDGAFVSAGTLGLLDIQTALGRGFVPGDDRRGAPPVALLGTGVWRSRYAGDPSILGRPVLINGSHAVVIGIVPDRSGFPGAAEIWLPLAQKEGLLAGKRDARSLSVFGRAQDGIAIAKVRADLESVATRLSRDHPDTNADVRARVVPINEHYLGKVTDPGWLSFIAVGVLIVVISSANVANLMLARGLLRTREIAIRASLGASRGRVVRQLLIEGSVLAALGGAAGLGVASLGVSLFRRAVPAGALPYWLDYSMDGRVIAALVLVSIATVLVFALAPALHVSKTDVHRALKDGGRTGTASPATTRWTTAFLTAELALAVLLLGEFSGSLRANARPVIPSDTALDAADVLTATITLPAASYASPDQRADFHRRLDERIRALPAVVAVSLTNVLPLSGGAERRLDLPDRPRPAGDESPTVLSVSIRPHYFEALGLPLLRGRDFTERDGMPGEERAIVNERLASLYFNDRDPIGQRIAIGPTDGAQTQTSSLTIVGVAPAIRQRQSALPEPIVYVPYRAATSATGSLVVRTSGDIGSLVSQLRAEVLALDANLPVYRTRSLADVMRDAQWGGRISQALFMTLTAIAVGLATLGLYAVTAYTVSQRTLEIGIRLALGARPLQVWRLVFRRLAAQLVLGFLAGVGCVFGWERMFSTGTAGVRGTDPASLMLVAAMLAVLALVAGLAPALRAMRLDPVTAIRDW